MEQFWHSYPDETITFLKRTNRTTIITGTVVTTPLMICQFVTWHSDHSTDWWSLLRILLFLIQIPPRFEVLTKLKRHRDHDLERILKSPSWKFTQIASFIVTLWVLTTIIYTISVYRRLFFINDLTDDEAVYFCVEGNLSPCLLRWSYITVIVFASRILFIVWWFKRVMMSADTKSHEKCYHLLPLESPQDRCAICIDDVHSEHHRFVELNQCPHRFHQKCIDEWFKKKMQCPLCKKEYGPNHGINDELLVPNPRRIGVHLMEQQRNNNNVRFRVNGRNRSNTTDSADERNQRSFGGIDTLWG